MQSADEYRKKGTDLENDTTSSGHENEDIYYQAQSSMNSDILFELEDDVLTKKMGLVNHAINKIGYTPFHWKLFCLNGMGYAVDSLLTLLHSVCQTSIAAEFLFAEDYNWVVTANYIGLLSGALFWGTTSDIIGRRIAFHVTLFGTALFAIAAAGGLTYPAVLVLSAISYAFAGGNLVLDAVCFLEFLPHSRQWLLTFMALWWGVGQIVTSALAWPLISNFSCGAARKDQAEWDENPCLRSENMGWRYTYICCGVFVLICALLRITVIRMVESPKYEIGQGKDEEVIKILDKLAESGKTVNPLTIEDLRACGTIKKDFSDKKFLDKIQPRHAFTTLGNNFRGLYANKKLGWTSTLIFLSWSLIGMAYPLYNAFLPQYLQSRGAASGDDSIDTTYRNNLIVTACSIVGPMIAGPLCEVPKVGRKGTLAIGGIITMVFMICYTKVTTNAQNLGINCAINVFVNVYYGTLYAFTPEALPANQRGTGNGVAAALARVMGAIAPVIGFYTGIATATPIYVLAALFGVMGLVALLFPYEIRGKSSM